MRVLAHGINAEKIASVVVSNGLFVMTYFDGNAYRFELDNDDVLVIYEDKKIKEEKKE